jgi:hypothetical protein
MVGTIDVRDTTTNPKFSGIAVDLPPGGWPTISVGGFQQIAIVQCRDASESIVWQTYFYGKTFQSSRYTNARAIAVWPAESEEDTRVAICGETCDQELPLSQLGSPLSSNASDPTGYVAVFNGRGTLLWSHQFFSNDFTSRCAITDLSIRVEDSEEGTYDVVTYCGISSHGNPGSGVPLSPKFPFAAPTWAGSSFYVGAAGNTSSGSGQWDGIVGRLRHEQGTSTTTQDFHSIVGGSEMDGLFGLAELSDDRFVVVGNTKRINVSTSATAFPFTEGTEDWNDTNSATPAYCVATVTVFDAAPTRSSGALLLMASHSMGFAGSFESLARDVWAAEMGSGNSIYIVGSTNDWTDSTTNFLTSCINSTSGPITDGEQLTFGGTRDGFLVWTLFAPGSSASPVVYLAGTYYGGASDDGLTGVAGWNEVPEYCVVSGYTNSSGAGNFDLVAASYSNTSAGAPTVSLAREDIIGSSAQESAAVMGPTHATSSLPLTYPTSLGSPAGGGAAVDPRARVTIVGASNSAGAGTPYPTLGGNGPLGGQDAVRTTFDMLPQGVWRTDATGTRAAAFGSVPVPSGYDGGTSPTSCINDFGRLIGEPAPLLPRMFIDYRGSAPAPTVSTGIVGVEGVPPGFIAAVIQYGFPGSPSGIPGSTIELWTPSSPASLGVGQRYFYVFPGGMPSGSYEFTVQIVFLLSSALSCDSGATLALAATPGLVISY